MVSSPQSPSPVPSGPVPPARRLGILPRAASGSVSCVVAAAAIAIAGLVAVGVGAAGLVYLRFAGSLPAPEELRARAATFRSSRILDKDGQPLAEAFDADKGRRDVVPPDHAGRGGGDDLCSQYRSDQRVVVHGERFLVSGRKHRLHHEVRHRSELPRRLHNSGAVDGDNGHRHKRQRRHALRRIEYLRSQ